MESRDRDLLTLLGAVFFCLGVRALFFQWPWLVLSLVLGKEFAHRTGMGDLTLVQAALSAVYVIAGFCCVARRARFFCIVAAGLACIDLLPYGLLFGVFALVVLSRPTAKAEFAMRPRRGDATGTPEKQAAPVAQRRWHRLAFSLAAGLAVFWVAYYAAYRELGLTYPYRIPYDEASRSVDYLRGKVSAFRQSNGKFPEKLDEIKTDEKRLIDPWGTPYQYQVTDGAFEIWSLGRDKKTGGLGLDVDLYGRTGRTRPHPTFWQFARDLDEGGHWDSCFFGALLTLVMAFLLARRFGTPRFELVVSLAVTAMFSVGLAVFLAMLHVPSGH